MELYSKCFITCIPHAALSFYSYALCHIFMCTSVAMETDTSDVTLLDLQRCEIEGSDSDKVENSNLYNILCTVNTQHTSNKMQ
jgi:hypothetical protein